MKPTGSRTTMSLNSDVVDVTVTISTPPPLEDDEDIAIEELEPGLMNIEAGPPDSQTPGDAGNSQDSAEEEQADQHQRELDLELEDAWEPTREPTNIEGDLLHQQPAPTPAPPIEDDDDDDVLLPLPPPALNSPVVIKYSKERPNKRPGCAISTKTVGDKVYGQAVNNEENLWAPFARWAKLRGPGSTALTELLAIEGVVDALNLSFKNTETLNKRIDDHLPQRPQFKRHKVVVAGESFELYARDIIECIRVLWQDPEFTPYLCFEPERHYADKDKKERLYHDMNTGRWWRATQEQVEQETGKKDVTIIPIIISSDKTQLTTFRNKQAYPVYLTIGNIPKHIPQILLAYLPTSKLDHIPNKAAQRRALANLFHACLSFILEPLKVAGVDGIMLHDGNGEVRRGHPILACYVGDYPEQTLVGAVKQGNCAVCPATRDTLDEHDPDWDFRDVDAVRDALNSQRCLEAGIKPVQDPFWKELPFVHIYCSITPDVLHQLYQGVVKHVILWLHIICGSDEIDARCRRLPPNHNIQLFLKGISHLSRVTGTKHDQICRFLLGLIVDIQLPHGYSNVRLLRAVRSLLDFIHLARMPVHDNRSLDAMDLALETFEKTRDIFIDLEDEYPQMTAWLDRQERILLHEKYIQRRLELRELPPLPTIPPSIPEHLLKMALHPTKARVSFAQAVEAYGASDFENALKRFIVSYPNNLTLLFSHISTFHRIKFISSDPHSLTPNAEVVVDSIHCDPAMLDRHGHEIPGRFDTALVHYKKRGHDSDLRDYRVARVRCIFSLPKMAGHLFRARAPPSHLVYVDWCTPFSSTSLAAYHGMHRISPYKINGKLQSSVIPVTLIQQSVHLIPQFGPVAPAEWKSSNVLDMATHFFL
ncbi:hypothetical protein DFP72DRAFT_991307 [Ephemerocybe angulata]|uniref:Uncharacterized protein n=1 Tax=Ephemerocybe angulata TaxID=980116 RepID=A0A8H6M464_9AGAR|nr:hypothetical protein DFP72DRAFT_991307 [Tulosesus angulatus]